MNDFSLKEIKLLLEGLDYLPASREKEDLKLKLFSRAELMNLFQTNGPETSKDS